MQAVKNKVLKRIYQNGKGSVFSAKDFLDLGSRAAVDQTLARLARNDSIRRLKRGLYDYPKTSDRLGPLSPSPDQIAKAVAAKTGSRLMPSGAHAANALGLSTQVPARLTYLTDGPSRQIQVGNQTITLKHAVPKRFALDGGSALAVQALRYLGKDNVDDQVVDTLRQALSDQDKAKLQSKLSTLPGWIVPIAKQLTPAA